MIREFRVMVLSFAFLISLIPSSHVSANATPTMVIMDTALDTSIPEIRNNLVYEVCILDWNSCPNGTDFMEGPGASTMSKSLINLSGFGHGTQMTSAAIRTYPKLQFIFVRIIANSSSGARLSTTEGTIARALDWVYKNKDRFNIVSIGLAQSHHRLWSGSDYCPTSPQNVQIIRKLLNAGIPIFVASGNNSDKNRVSWPACIPETMAISAITNQTISRYSNFDQNLSDFAAIGEMRVLNAGGVVTSASGTSISTQVIAAIWTRVRAEFPSFSYQETFDFLRAVSADIRVESSILSWVDVKTVNNKILRETLASQGLSQSGIEEFLRCLAFEKQYLNYRMIAHYQFFCAK